MYIYNTMKTKITLKHSTHKNQEIICAYFDYDEQLKTIIKNMNASWSQTLKCWYFKMSDFSLNNFYKKFSSKAFIDYSNVKNLKTTTTESKPSIKEQLSAETSNTIHEFYKYLTGKRFSTSTIKTYSFLVAEFLIYHKQKLVDNKREIELFIEDVYVKKNVSISTHRQFVSAINHYLDFTQSGFRLDFAVDAPKKDKKLPNILSKEEIIRLIQVTKNLKHRVCITLLYSSGLRIGELLNLRLKDLDFDRNLLRVEMSKGRKDRYVPLAKSILPMLKNYLNTYEPKFYLIENDINNTKYAQTTVRTFLKRNLEIAQIKKHVTPHTLRHSYATHLLESGTDIRYIQTLLGHYRPETTMIYTHVQSEDLQKINNPLDLIVEQHKISQKRTNFIADKND